MAGGCDVITAGHEQVDLQRQEQTELFLTGTKPDVVVVAAAKVGGIHANHAYPAEFIANNLAIALNVIHGSYMAGVKKLLFSVHLVSIQNSLVSRLGRRNCSPGHLSRQMNGMQLPR
jgi:nucleoside-diphosphate-sugar epimerase